MKIVYFLIALHLLACNGNVQEADTGNNPDSVNKEVPSENSGKDIPSSAKNTYSNARFKEVTVEKVGEHTFSIQGKGQIFEANFGWVVEDGHNELKEGFQMTDAGAPEWGNFQFEIEVKKRRTNSTLTLILFETSAKDGSRQYTLPVVLE
jgi:hypothetical protein